MAVITIAVVGLVAGLAVACARPAPTLTGIPAAPADPATPDPDLFAAAAPDSDNAPAALATVAPQPSAAPRRGGYDGSCTGKWRHPDTTGPVLGSAGHLLTFTIAVEQGAPVAVDEFTQLVDATLGSGRSWVGAANVRLRRMPGASGANFTIYLACPWTAYSMCATGGLNIKRNGYPYTSCRVGNWVVINADRYLYNADAVRAVGGSLADYRHYLINHEVGHRLGHDHEHCPGRGQLAPVMQQQTLRMEGCRFNGWPFWWNPTSGATVYPGPVPTEASTTAATPTVTPAATPAVTPAVTPELTPEATPDPTTAQTLAP